jgi:hypothetical protein
VFVIVLVLIATITFSLLLRRPPQSGEGLSMARPNAAPALVAAHEAYGEAHNEARNDATAELLT